LTNDDLKAEINGDMEEVLGQILTDRLRIHITRTEAVDELEGDINLVTCGKIF
jgi:hypothetical protein